MGNILLAVIVVAIIVIVYFAVGFLGRFIDDLKIARRKQTPDRKAFENKKKRQK